MSTSSNDQPNEKTNLEGSTLKVLVLMSTFNGERYVTAQLQSILSQLPVGGQILIRDDGSTDRTIDAIRALNDDRIEWVVGPNLGFGGSFLTLLANAPPDADMVLFADQDDVWLPGKIERAWSHLQSFGAQPALYGGAQMLVDADLQPLHVTPPWPRGPSLLNALNENIITGCTAALNRCGAALLRDAGVPPSVRFHDWWMYLVVSAFGTVVYDEQPMLLYRQHGGNQIGHGAGWLGRRLGIVRFLLRNDWVGILLGQLTAFWQHYGHQLDGATQKMLLEQFSFRGPVAVQRWSMILGLRRSRQTLGSELAFRVLLLLHRLYLWPLPRTRRTAVDEANTNR
jgi:glycosyltransferase involved in cell wall biosynthesis